MNMGEVQRMDSPSITDGRIPGASKNLQRFDDDEEKEEENI